MSVWWLKSWPDCAAYREDRPSALPERVCTLTEASFSSGSSSSSTKAAFPPSATVTSATRSMRPVRVSTLLSVTVAAFAPVWRTGCEVLPRVALMLPSSSSTALTRVATLNVADLLPLATGTFLVPPSPSPSRAKSFASISTSTTRSLASVVGQGLSSFSVNSAVSPSEMLVFSALMPRSGWEIEGSFLTVKVTFLLLSGSPLNS